MKAAQFVEPGVSLRLVEMEKPGAMPGCLVFKVKACGICASDLHAVETPDMLEPGVVLGHEYAGEVVEVGDGVEGWQAGDRLIAIPGSPCGACATCQEGRFVECEDFVMQGFDLRMSGGYAEYCSCVAELAMKVPDELSDTEAATIEPLAVGLNAWKTAQVEDGSSVLVLGAGEKAASIRNALEKGEIRGLNIVTYIPMPGDKDVAHKDAIQSLDKPLIQYVEEEDIDEIVIAVDDRRTGSFPTKDLIDCKMSGISVLDLATFFERRAGKIRLDLVNPSWLYLSEGFDLGNIRKVLKRIMDVAIVLALLPLALPMTVLVATAIFIESGGRGSVLYTQIRVKQDGLPFKIYKFRSMVSNAEKIGEAKWASKNDPRITRVGKFLREVRLDELPQLFNILKGDMSFVGPRPERPEFIEKLAKEVPYYEERHRVKPGLTGWAQVCYSYGDTVGDSIEKLQYDLYYVKNYSVLLDLLILLQTAEVVMLRKGAQ